MTTVLQERRQVGLNNNYKVLNLLNKKETRSIRISYPYSTG